MKMKGKSRGKGPGEGKREEKEILGNDIVEILLFYHVYI